MQREIVLDTETTGLSHRTGDRLVEIGCIEIANRIPTGVELHLFVNPERDVPAEAEAVHGLSTDFLRDKPLFKAVADEFLAFIGNDPLVIHNASFDIGFLNAELKMVGKPPLLMDRVVDTLQLARRKHPAGPNNLDALCRRYNIDLSRRVKHGAILDSLLLAEVYIELLGERQAMLGLAQAGQGGAGQTGSTADKTKQRSAALPPRLSADDQADHKTFVETLGEDALWHKVSLKSGSE